jgi:hypothetical protein
VVVRVVVVVVLVVVVVAVVVAVAMVVVVAVVTHVVECDVSNCVSILRTDTPGQQRHKARCRFKIKSCITDPNTARLKKMQSALRSDREVFAGNEPGVLRSMRRRDKPPMPLSPVLTVVVKKSAHKPGETAYWKAQQLPTARDVVHTTRDPLLGACTRNELEVPFIMMHTISVYTV